MKAAAVTFLTLALSSSLFAQEAISPTRAVKRLDLPPRGSQPPPPRQSAPTPPTPSRYATPAVSAPPKPTEIVSKIDASLAASAIKNVGTADGLAGRMYITNLSQSPVSATAQFAILDRNGVQIGLMSKSTDEVAQNGFVKIQVVTPNANAGEFKLMKLTPASK